MSEKTFENKKTIITVIIAILIFLIVFGISYAYFTSSSTANTKTVTTGQLSLKFDDNTNIVNASNIYPILAEIDANQNQYRTKKNLA